MASYYYLTSALPPLQIGTPPDTNFHEFVQMLQENLNEEDLGQVQKIRRFYDLQNLRHLWLESGWDSRGNLSETQMQEALATEAELPEYVFDYLEKYDGTTSRLGHFNALLSRYYEKEIPECTGFLQDYLLFEREWRLVFVGFRAKKENRDLASELQFEDSADDLIMQLLAQKDAKSYEPPARYEDLKGLFESHKEDPYELHKALAEFRFERVALMTEGELFGMERILAYMVQLIIVERWEALDQEQGEQVVHAVVQSAK